MLQPTESMTKINSRIYLGTLWNVEQLLKDNPKPITHVLNCTDDASLDRQLDGFTYARLDQLDGSSFALSAIHGGLDFIRHGLCQDGSVLVCCHAGLSRSPAMVIAFLYTTGMTWKEAREYVITRRPIVYPHAKVEESFLKAFGLSAVSAYGT
jgi:protein-tyrosine phosphatase